MELHFLQVTRNEKFVPVPLKVCICIFFCPNRQLWFEDTKFSTSQYPLNKTDSGFLKVLSISVRLLIQKCVKRVPLSERVRRESTLLKSNSSSRGSTGGLFCEIPYNREPSPGKSLTCKCVFSIRPSICQTSSTCPPKRTSYRRMSELLSPGIAFL